MNRLLVVLLLLACAAGAWAQPATTERYPLPRRVMPLEKALIKLVEAGAPLSYRPDQLPQLVVRVPGGSRQLEAWLNYLLRDTELTYRTGPAGWLILPDPNLLDREFTVSGMITDATSGERLIGAPVYVPDRNAGVLTNEYGFYSLVVRGGRVRLRASYTGYQARDLDFLLRADTTLDLRLATAANLPQIEVIARSETSELYLTETETTVGPAEVDLVNGPGGEPDIVNVARLLPGVTSGADGVGGLNIRGSDAGHNLVLLDGVPVYNLSHAGGLFSIFNSSAIRKADVYKDGLPARFGGRIGGVLDVHTRDGNLYHPQLSVGSSLLAAHVTAEGPISTGKSSFLVAGRYFWGGDVLRRLSRTVKARNGRTGEVGYAVHDLNFKLNQQVSDRGRLYLSLYRGLDDYTNRGRRVDDVRLLTLSGSVVDYRADQKRTEDFNWGNTVGALRYNHVFNDRLFTNFRLSYSDLLVRADYERSDSLIRDGFEITRDISSGRFGSSIQQLGAAFDGQWRMGARAGLRFGLSADAHRFTPQLRAGRVPLAVHPKLSELTDAAALRATQLSAYLSYEGGVGRLHYRAGLRGQYWRSSNGFVNLSPRLLLAYSVSGKHRLRATAERLSQPIHLVSSTVIRLPTDLWVPATRHLRPSTVDQVSLRYAYHPAPAWQLDVTAYYRDMNHLVDFGRSSTGSSWIDSLSVGSGFASGVELSVRHTGRRFGGWVNYTLATSRRQFDRGVNLGRPFPFAQDRRHSFKALLTYQPSPRTTLTATFRFETGGAYSFSKESFVVADPTPVDPEAQEQTNFLVDNKNGFRFPANHRLDVNSRWQLTRRADARFRHTLNLGIYNLYSRHNPIFYDLRTTYFGRDDELIKDRQFVQIFLGGILPTLTYKVTFGPPGR